MANCCAKRSRLEQILFVLVVILAIALITVSSVYISKYLELKKICTNPECLKSTVRILERLDLDLDPCDDFYQFACGKYLNFTSISGDKSRYSSIDTINDLVDLQLKTLLEQPIRRDEPKSHKLAKQLYESCMKSPSEENATMSKFHEILDQTGGWPVLKGYSWNQNSFNWVTQTQKFMDVGLISNMFISLDVVNDMRNTSNFILYLDQPPLLPLYGSMMKGFQDPAIKALHQYLIKIAVTLGAQENTAEKDMREVIEFLTQISKISMSPESRRNVFAEATYMTVNQIQNEFPYVAWGDYINMALRPFRRLESDEEIMIASFSYLKKLGALLSATPKTVLANYMYTRATDSIVTYLSDELRTINFEYARTFSGVGTRAARWKECSKLSSTLAPATGGMYIQKYFNEDSKSSVLEIVQNIRQEVINSIEKCDWMDENTKNNAVEKAKAMKSYIGYPDQLLDFEKVDSIYKKLNLNTDNFLEYMLNLEKFRRELSASYSNNRADEFMWLLHSTVTDTNAIFVPFENAMDFRASILQDIFFEKGRPNYLNYGAIGFVVGHEMTHAFDDQGKQFDKNGNLKSWWEPDTEKKFQNKAKCIIDQYGKINIPGTNVTLNGVNTQGENIADNGGIRQAYRAYIKWLDEHGPEPTLPGLPYTSQQMFWISYGTTWCSLQTPERLQFDVVYDVHPPNRYRVNVPLMNTDLFSKDFHCSAGSKMNPEDKCEGIW